VTFQEAKQHLARKLNIDYSDIGNNDLFNDTDLGEFINQAILKAWDFKFWDFTEEKVAGTTSGATLAYPQNLKSESIFYLRINSKRYTKKNFQDFLGLLEDYPTTTDKIWAEFKRTIYFNTNAFTVGQSYELYGKGVATKLSGSSDLLPFSPDTDDKEDSGNEAIVQLAYAEVLDSEKKKEYAQAKEERKKAYETLEILWKPFAEARANAEILRPMFDVPDFLNTSKNSADYTGNFNYL
jgi:hypothetical protein